MELLILGIIINISVLQSTVQIPNLISFPHFTHNTEVWQG